MSRQLATIKTDVALDVGPIDLQLRQRDVDTLRTLYKRYEFNAALKELDAGNPAPAARDLPAADIPTHREFGVRGIGEAPKIIVDPALQGPGTYELVTTSEQLERWLGKLRTAELIAFDTETDSLDPMQAEVIGISIAVAVREAAYIPLGHDCPGTPSQLDRADVLNRLKPLLEDSDKAKLGQNAKYDINVLSTYGITMRGVAHDTMLESYVLNSTASRHDMDSLAKRHLAHETIPYEQVDRQRCEADSVLAGRHRNRVQVRRRGRRRHVAPASRAVAEARSRAASARRLRDDRDAARAGARAHGADRRPDRYGRAEASEQRARDGACTS